jgi:hypothetical protein
MKGVSGNFAEELEMWRWIGGYKLYNKTISTLKP